MAERVALRPMAPGDVAEVLALNAREVHLLAPMDEATLWRIHALARGVEVIEVGGQFAGFVITVGPGTAYDSENYRWFESHLEAYVYLDRVVLHESVRRQGVGGTVYDRIEAQARAELDIRRTARLALEVNLDPPNEPSLAFHHKRGYVEVAQLGAPGHRVSLLVKDLTTGM